jgi:nicotinamidase-related amidase
MARVLLLIDPQIDFHEGGSLAVSGAAADSARVAKLLESSSVDEVVITLDTHSPWHIANCTSWVDAHGAPASPFTQVSHEDVVKGTFVPKRNELRSYAAWYTQRLEASPLQFKLTLWPEHCIQGSRGHAIQPELFEAIQRWSAKTGKDYRIILKGQNPLTEMYSAVAAEVPLGESEVAELVSSGALPSFTKHDPATTRQGNAALVDSLVGSSISTLIVAGQALSHCVRYTVLDLLHGLSETECAKLWLLRDGSSSVGGFEAAGDEFAAGVAARGGRVLSCAEAMELLATPLSPAPP